MSDTKLTIEPQKTTEAAKTNQAKSNEKVAWETPKLEDVSEEVMAQPYIRFT